MKFEPIEPTDRAPTVVAVRSGDARERHEALLSLALRDRDWRFVQELCLDIITGDPDLDLRATAVLGLGPHRAGTSPARTHQGAACVGGRPRAQSVSGRALRRVYRRLPAVPPRRG